MSEIERQRMMYEAACRVPSQGVLRAKWNDGSKRLSGNGFDVVLGINNLDEAIDNIIYGEGRAETFNAFDDIVDELIENLRKFKSTAIKDTHSPESEQT